jgi:hypothetical protein
MHEIKGFARLKIHPGKLRECIVYEGTPTPHLRKALEGSPVRIYTPYRSL